MGTDICAAREGKIISIESAIPDSQVKDIRGLKSQTNFVIIQHNDDTYALYAHLKSGSIRHKNHQYIKKGECFAQSGNSGNSTGPHLHFAILLEGLEDFVSIPIKFANKNNNLSHPENLSWIER
jgi:murein DD-endopeptidase MepM/ murein hydrolase activator NlpD